MLKKITFSLFIPIIFLFIVSQTRAAEVQVFDSTDHYLGSCQLTNKAEWQLDKDLDVSKFQLWYRWNEGETTLPVTVYRDGEKFAEFTANRAECDAYQKQWCNANYPINKQFTAGKYSAEIPESRMCLKPGSTGTIRLYQENQEESAPINTQAVAQPTTTCSYGLTIAVTAFISLVTSFVLAMLLFKR